MYGHLKRTETALRHALDGTARPVTPAMFAMISAICGAVFWAWQGGMWKYETTALLFKIFSSYWLNHPGTLVCAVTGVILLSLVNPSRERDWIDHQAQGELSRRAGGTQRKPRISMVVVMLLIIVTFVGIPVASIGSHNAYVPFVLAFAVFIPQLFGFWMRQFRSRSRLRERVPALGVAHFGKRPFDVGVVHGTMSRDMANEIKVCHGVDDPCGFCGHAMVDYLQSGKAERPEPEDPLTPPPRWFGMTGLFRRLAQVAGLQPQGDTGRIVLVDLNSSATTSLVLAHEDSQDLKDGRKPGKVLLADFESEKLQQSLSPWVDTGRIVRVTLPDFNRSSALKTVADTDTTTTDSPSAEAGPAWCQDHPWWRWRDPGLTDDDISKRFLLAARSVLEQDHQNAPRPAITVVVSRVIYNTGRVIDVAGICDTLEADGFEVKLVCYGIHAIGNLGDDSALIRRSAYYITPSFSWLRGLPTLSVIYVGDGPALPTGGRAWSEANSDTTGAPRNPVKEKVHQRVEALSRCRPLASIAQVQVLSNALTELTQERPIARELLEPYVSLGVSLEDMAWQSEAELPGLMAAHHKKLAALFVGLLEHQHRLPPVTRALFTFTSNAPATGLVVMVFHNPEDSSRVRERLGEKHQPNQLQRGVLRFCFQYFISGEDVRLLVDALAKALIEITPPDSPLRQKKRSESASAQASGPPAGST